MLKMRLLAMALLIFAFTISIAAQEKDPLEPVDPEEPRDRIETGALIIEDLSSYIYSLNLARGITNSLDAKLDNALRALGDVRDGQVESACNRLIAFQLEVAAQSGKAITEDDAATALKYSDSALVTLGCY